MAEDFDVEDVAPEPSSNRTFVIVAVGMGAVLLLSVACLAAYLLFWVPRQRETQQAQQATELAAANLQGTESALELTETARPSDTATFEPPTEQPSFTPSNTPTRTETPVIVQATQTETDVPATPWGTAATWTVVAQQTSTALAAAQGGGDPTTTPTAASTALPETGFADSIPPSQLILAALILLVVVLASRAVRRRFAS